MEIPFSSFNIGSFNGKVVLGVAQQTGDVMVGDKKVLKLDEVCIIYPDPNFTIGDLILEY